MLSAPAGGGLLGAAAVGASAGYLGVIPLGSDQIGLSVTVNPGGGEPSSEPRGQAQCSLQLWSYSIKLHVPVLTDGIARWPAYLFSYGTVPTLKSEYWDEVSHASRLRAPYAVPGTDRVRGATRLKRRSLPHLQRFRN
eukprot:2410756-Rhodomonas_salina.1